MIVATYGNIVDLECIGAIPHHHVEGKLILFEDVISTGDMASSIAAIIDQIGDVALFAIHR
ncbi:hypothetical protein L286_20520 [Sphingobium sp. HDIP04]|nr:hypothetical protein L286_20520 [Sphingobium sp. HDIP04]